MNARTEAIADETLCKTRVRALLARLVTGDLLQGIRSPRRLLCFFLSIYLLDTKLYVIRDKARLVNNISIYAFSIFLSKGRRRRQITCNASNS